MVVSQLIKILQSLPGDMIVVVQDGPDEGMYRVATCYSIQDARAGNMERHPELFRGLADDDTIEVLEIQ